MKIIERQLEEGQSSSTAVVSPGRDGLAKSVSLSSRLTVDVERRRNMLCVSTIPYPHKIPHSWDKFSSRFLHNGTGPNIERPGYRIISSGKIR